MDMSTSSNSSMSMGGGDLEGWKPYLHTSLFSPFSNDPSSGEAFLFPSFRIYSLATFLAASLFTFFLALTERFLSYLLEHHLTLTSDRLKRPRKSSSAASSVYLNIGSPDTSIRRSTTGRLIARNLVFGSVTALRYVLMIVGMGMDWFLLLSVVAGLTVGHFVTDVWIVHRTNPSYLHVGSNEEVELLHPDEDEGENVKQHQDDYLESGQQVHRRSTSRRASFSTP